MCLPVRDFWRVAHGLELVHLSAVLYHTCCLQPGACWLWHSIGKQKLQTLESQTPLVQWPAVRSLPGSAIESTVWVTLHKYLGQQHCLYGSHVYIIFLLLHMSILYSAYIWQSIDIPFLSHFPLGNYSSDKNLCNRNAGYGWSLHKVNDVLYYIMWQYQAWPLAHPALSIMGKRRKSPAVPYPEAASISVNSNGGMERWVNIAVGDCLAREPVICP